MTADELARVTAERDAAVAALARVEALHRPATADEARDGWEREGKDCVGCWHDYPCLTARAATDALVSPESDAGAEVRSADPDEPNGVQIGTQGRCPDCEWVPAPQRWHEIANNVPTELVLGKTCGAHGRAGERRLGR